MAEVLPFWARVECMGYASHYGLVSEQEIAGGKLLKVETPQDDGTMEIKLVGVQSIYAITPCSEADIRQRLGLAPDLHQVLELSEVECTQAVDDPSEDRNDLPEEECRTCGECMHWTNHDPYVRDLIYQSRFCAVRSNRSMRVSRKQNAPACEHFVRDEEVQNDGA